MKLLMKSLRLLGRRVPGLETWAPQHHSIRCMRTSCSHLQEAASASGSGTSDGDGYPGVLRENYLCDQAWNKRLETPLLQKVNLDDFFYDIDKRYQSDKVISAIDVDLFVNKVTDVENLDELEELVHRLRKSPATADTLPSTSYALIRAFMKAGKYDELMRILNDRWNYGVFLDHHVANILMDEFLKQGNHRDAAKVASLLMLEEDFGTPTSRYFSVLSCLKYLQNPTPDPWDTHPMEIPEDEVKVRVHFIRNPYFDDHFDLTDPNHVVGKTLTMVSGELSEDHVFTDSIRLLGLTLHGKWDKVEFLLQTLINRKAFVAEESVTKCLELCDKALADIEASPDKTLPKPKLIQYPSVNLDEKSVKEMWNLLKYPEYEKFVPKVKSLLTSNQLSTKKEFNLIDKAKELLSRALTEREDKEIQEQINVFKEWDEKRSAELDKQVKRFKTFEVSESVKQRKKELEEKEEVIFFFDNEEEWMMRLPPDQQQGYKLDTKYIPINSIKFVRSVPPKKEKKKKKKTTTT